VSQRATDLRREEAAGFTRLESYLTFTEKVQETKRKLLEFLIGAKRAGKSVVPRRRCQRCDPVELLRARNHFIDYAVDLIAKAPLCTGVRIPIFNPDRTMKPWIIFDTAVESEMRSCDRWLELAHGWAVCRACTEVSLRRVESRKKLRSFSQSERALI
jgi:hypothetical protein